jgi:dephospho-CoA kinase
MSHYVVGLTGGIGSGKTAVSDRFAALGIVVVDADIASRVIVEPGRPALLAIHERFGDSVIAADGTLNRQALGAIVFADPGERRALEAITHPYINEYMAGALAAAESPYAILAHPLLIETSRSKVCQRVLVVDVPEALQIERTVARDGRDEAQVRDILAAQATREERLAAADDVIVNDQDLAHLDREVARLHEQYLVLARSEEAR